MDDDEIVCYKEERYKEVAEEMKDMLGRVGWKKDFVKESVPIIPISGYMGDNLIKKSDKMAWWKGVDVKDSSGKSIHVHTVQDALNDFCGLPERKITAELRMPLSDKAKSMKGIGDVVTGRIVQGTLKPGDEVIFLPTHTSSTPCQGKIYSIEMHHARLEEAQPGDNIGINIKGLEKSNLPCRGDVMVKKNDTTLGVINLFTAQIQTLENIPKEIKPGYSPIGFVHCTHTSCKIKAFNWKEGRETGGKRLESPHSLKANEKAEVVFELDTSQRARGLAIDTFQNCEGLSRIAFLEGNSAVMIGKIIKVN